VIPAGLADAIRYADAVLALALMVTSGWSAVLADHWDQRVRFGLFAAFAFTLTGGHLSALGREGTWYLVILVVIVVVALVSTVAYIRRELRERELRGRRAR